MGFTRGKYGIEHNSDSRGGGESHPLRWLLPLLAVIALGSFIWARGCTRDVIPEADTTDETPVAPLPPEPPQPADTPATTVSSPKQTAKPAAQTVKPAVQQSAKPVAEKPKPVVKPHPEVSTKAVASAERWLETARTRSPDEAALLARLADAERQGNKRIVRDTLEKLRRRNTMADLDDPFARRLGALNAEILFDSDQTERDGWTVQVTVKKGDSAQRIAREHGTTLAALLKLNELKDPNKLRIGAKLRVLEFPRAELVVHAGLHFADLSLNKRFFKRYDISLPQKPEIGSYPITREDGPMDRFKALSFKLIPADREELAILLAPGSRLIVSPM